MAGNLLQCACITVCEKFGKTLTSFCEYTLEVEYKFLSGTRISKPAEYQYKMMRIQCNSSPGKRCNTRMEGDSWIHFQKANFYVWVICLDFGMWGNLKIFQHSHRNNNFECFSMFTYFSENIFLYLWRCKYWIFSIHLGF